MSPWNWPLFKIIEGALKLGFIRIDCSRKINVVHLIKISSPLFSNVIEKGETTWIYSDNWMIINTSTHYRKYLGQTHGFFLGMVLLYETRDRYHMLDGETEDRHQMGRSSKGSHVSGSTVCDLVVGLFAWGEYSCHLSKPLDYDIDLLSFCTVFVVERLENPSKGSRIDGSTDDDLLS